jgi:hypothetical protein
MLVIFFLPVNNSSLFHIFRRNTYPPPKTISIEYIEYIYIYRLEEYYSLLFSLSGASEKSHRFVESKRSVEAVLNAGLQVTQPHGDNLYFSRPSLEKEERSSYLKRRKGSQQVRTGAEATPTIA